MTAALVILAAAAAALAAAYLTSRQTIRAARAAIDQARDDADAIEAERLAAIRPALAILDHHQEQTTATLRRFAGADPTTAAEIAADLHRAAVERTRGEDEAA